MKKYEVLVTGIGELAAEFFEQNMLILFNNDAPADLKEIAVSHSKCRLLAEVATGDRICLGENVYTVTAVGHEANKTLASMGHATFRFDGAEAAELPGNIHLAGGGPPRMAVGDKVSVEV